MTEIESLNEHIWPEIHAMMLNDAYFKLVRYFYELTKQHNEVIISLILNGYITFQMTAIRRLSDSRRDAFSLRRIVEKLPDETKRELLKNLDACAPICDQVNDHIAHRGNPNRRSNFSEWKLTSDALTSAQKGICKTAISLQRIYSVKGHSEIIPVGSVNMLQFNVSDEYTQKLWDFWHKHNESVKNWISSS